MDIPPLASVAWENSVTRFVFQRAIRSLLTVWIVVSVLFVVLHVSGDPAVSMLGPDASQAALDAFRARHKLDDPLSTQYAAFFSSLARGDLGTSMQYDRPVTELIAQRAPATLELAMWAVLISVCLGVPAGAIAALRRNSLWDRTAMFGAFIGQSAPNFFVGILMILVLSLWLGWLPSSGRGSASQVIMPSFTLATGLLASIARMTRSSMLEVVSADFVRTARSKGLPERTIVRSHVFRNAAIPVVTLTGMWIGGILGGAAITETVFAWPGIGRLVVDSVSRRDYPVVQAVVMLVAVSVVTVNLVVDVLYGWLDPRISVTGQEATS